MLRRSSPDILDVSRVITGKLQLNLGGRSEAVISRRRGAPGDGSKGIQIETLIDASLRLVSGVIVCSSRLEYPFNAG